NMQAVSPFAKMRNEDGTLNWYPADYIGGPNPLINTLGQERDRKLYLPSRSCGLENFRRGLFRYSWCRSGQDSIVLRGKWQSGYRCIFGLGTAHFPPVL